MNKRRIVKLVQEERMTEAGMAKIDFDINEVDITEPALKKPEPELSPSIQKILMEDEIGWQNFNKLAPSHRRNYIGWIMDAKKEETQMKRAREALDLLRQNKKLGMK